jgi:hypothetical protein
MTPRWERADEFIGRQSWALYWNPDATMQGPFAWIMPLDEEQDGSFGWYAAIEWECYNGRFTGFDFPTVADVTTWFEEELGFQLPPLPA